MEIWRSDYVGCTVRGETTRVYVGWVLSCAYNKGKCPGNEGEMGDGTEQMRACYVTACACCGFVIFREKGEEITREESVCTYFQNVCVF
jgi:hypothetical protein